MRTTIWQAMMRIPGRLSSYMSGAFDSVDSQIEGLGRIDAVEQLYVAHTQAAIDSLGK